MSGQAAAKTVKEVKSEISRLETNQHLKGGGGGSEMNSNAKPGARSIGKK